MTYLYTAPVLSGTIPDPVGNPLTGDLTWTASLDGSTPATDYEVYRADIGNLGNTTTLGYNDTVPTFGSYTYTVAAVGGDPTTLLLMHLDADFSDSSIYNTVFANGSTVQSGGVIAAITTSIYEFGPGCLSCVPAGNNYASNFIFSYFSAGGTLDLSALPEWTIEFWLYPHAIGNYSQVWMTIGDDSSGGTCGIQFVSSGLSTGDMALNIWGATATGSGRPDNNTPMAAGQWHHIAAVKQPNTSGAGDVYTVYIDGYGVPTSSSNPYTGPYTPWSGAIVINGNYSAGSASGGGGANNGAYYDEIRISATAIYTANFTPPTAPFTISTAQLSPLSNPVTLTYGGLSSLYGKFAGAAAYKPNLLVDAKGLKPRIWMPKENVTVKT